MVEPLPEVRVWRVRIEGVWETKPRPAVVVSVEDDRVEVVYGGGTPHPASEHLEVTAASREGKEMGLTKDTYFRHGNVVFVTKDALKETMGTCPYDLFIEFETLAFEFHRRGRS